ncbi:MAG: ABC transporter permease [Paludibacteraceae bacterium]|nr:ABC transporter permease [Paludibacteraceae bacterium]
MTQFFSFVIKEARHILRDRRTMLILFGMPLAMMMILGFAITTDVRDVRTVLVTTSSDHLSTQMVNRLAASEYFSIVAKVASPAEAERWIRAGKADIAMVFSPRFASRGGVQFIVDGSDPNMAQQWTAYASGVLLNPQEGRVNSRMLFNPQMRSAYNFVPAIMGMLLMLICAMMTSISIVREKERGTMEVLLVSPVRPLMVLIAKSVPYFVLAFFVLMVIMLMARFVLMVPLAGSLFWIVAVSLLYILLALFVSSFGLTISNFSSNMQQAVFVMWFFIVFLMLLSGLFTPVRSMPAWAYATTYVNPMHYFIDAIRTVYIRGGGFREIYPHLIALSLLGSAMSLCAIITYRKNE